MNHFKKSWNGCKITYIFQNNPNGTGAALHLAKSMLGEKFLVMNGDDLYHKKDIKKMIKHDLAVLGYEVEDVTQFGILKTDRKKNLIDIVEKPRKSKDKLANAGLYMLNRKLFNYDLTASKSGEFFLTDLLNQMAKDHRIKVEKATFWHPIGNAKDLQKAEEIIHRFN
jgi:bifunctional UDP-N-acetylglucosamine pyrophosphorylase/glucosamine-1-phosphate N-acetyltransferase